MLKGLNLDQVWSAIFHWQESSGVLTRDTETTYDEIGYFQTVPQDWVAHTPHTVQVLVILIARNEIQKPL